MSGVLGAFLGWFSVVDCIKKHVSVWGTVLCAVTGVIMRVSMGNFVFADIFGGMAVGGCMIFVSLLSRQAIGMGDGMVLLAEGIYLGFWDNLMVLFWGMMFSGICSAFLLILKKVKRKTEIPFLPFLFAGYLVVIFI